MPAPFVADGGFAISIVQRMRAGTQVVSSRAIPSGAALPGLLAGRFFFGKKGVRAHAEHLHFFSPAKVRNCTQLICEVA